MRMNFLLLGVSIMILLLSCANKNNDGKSYKIEQSSVINIELSKVDFIGVSKGGNEYEIRDREKLKTTLSALNKSHIKYIKFGSKNTFKIYDTNKDVLVEGFFKDDIFKIKGVVYQANQTLFE
ncbi:hypothetical protein [Bergeyella sp. RCAD1439]|uniref:hypothetical protein n=1 Tax=Bergeyella anatis TaxID=3113737 RepID=UPI002E174A4C|nr:hypothetical protein [Bergeyella sp. RCAD1439]